MRALKNVLFVEDEPGILTVYEAAAKELGWRYYSAMSVDQMIDAVQSMAFSVAIVDLSLVPNDPNDRQGLRALSALTDLKDGTKCVVSSGKGEFRDTAMLMELHAVGVIEKKDHPHDLKHVICSAIVESHSAYIESQRRRTDEPLFEDVVEPLSGSKGAKQWQATLYDALRPAGGMASVYEALNDACGPIAPLVPPKNMEAPGFRDDSLGTIAGVAWSRGIGGAVIFCAGADFQLDSVEKQAQSGSVGPWPALGKIGRSDCGNSGIAVFRTDVARRKFADIPVTA